MRIFTKKSVPQSVFLNFLLVVFLIFLLTIGKLVAVGGVDTNVYKQIIYTSPSEWGSYYLGNLFSWSIIFTSFMLTANYPIGFSLALIDLIVWSIYFFLSKRDETFNTNLAPLAMFGAIGVLLSYNVLRQYISVVFFLVASIRFFQNRGVWNWHLFVLALFSHFSSAIFLLPLLLSRYNFKKKIVRFILFPMVYLVGLAIFQNFQPRAFAEAESIGDPVIELYAFMLLSLSVLVLFHMKVKLCAAGCPQPAKIHEVSKFLFYSFVTILGVAATNLPVWLVNRFLISFIFLTSSYVFITVPTSGAKNSRVYGRTVNFLTLCVLLATVLFHPGAAQMIGLN